MKWCTSVESRAPQGFVCPLCHVGSIRRRGSRRHFQGDRQARCIFCRSSSSSIFGRIDFWASFGLRSDHAGSGASKRTPSARAGRANAGAADAGSAVWLTTPRSLHGIGAGRCFAIERRRRSPGRAADVSHGPSLGCSALRGPRLPAPWRAETSLMRAAGRHAGTSDVLSGAEPVVRVAGRHAGSDGHGVEREICLAHSRCTRGVSRAMQLSLGPSS